MSTEKNPKPQPQPQKVPNEGAVPPSSGPPQDDPGLPRTRSPADERGNMIAPPDPWPDPPDK